MEQDQRPVFTMPLSGYGDFDSRFNGYYDKIQGYLMLNVPLLTRIRRKIFGLSNDDHLELNAEAGNEAGKQTLEYIESIGYRIEYPPDDPPRWWPEE